MRVTLVCPYALDRPGGVQDQVVKLARWLHGDGHEAAVVAPGVDCPEDLSDIPVTLLGRSVLVPVNRSAAPVGLDPRLARRVRHTVAAAGGDVVHVHEPLVPVVGLAALHGGGGVRVATFHSDPSPAVRRGYRVGAPLLRRLLRRCGAVTAVSPVAASVLGRIPVRLVPNGIDIAAAAPPAGVTRHPHRVVFLGRDEPRKGLPDLLAAWPAVRNRVPDAELTVVGAEPSGTVPDGVTFHGRVPEEEKRRLLASAAVMCAPNTGGESFGIVLVEAMAAGCAVVASAIPGFVHVLGDAAVLVAAGDHAGLGGALAGLLDDPGRLEELRRRGAERVRRYDRPAVLAGYLDAYEAALRAGPGSTHPGR